MKTSSLFSLAAFLPLLLSCSTSTEVRYSFWEGTLQPVLPNQEGGIAAAVSQFGRTEVSVELRQGQAGATYGWHLKSGSCQAPGTIVGGVANYALMETDESGIATESATVSGVLRSGDSYSVRVYRPLENGGEDVVACGDLVEDTDGGA